MNRLSKERRTNIIHCLVEGCSVRSTSRLTGTHIETVLGVLRHAGMMAQHIQEEVFREFETRHLQMDEVWTFNGMKRRTLKKRGIPEKSTEFGDWYVYSCMDTKSRAVPVFLVGRRDGPSTRKFVQNIRKRIRTNGKLDVELSTDGWESYERPILDEFGPAVSYGQLVKIHNPAPVGRERYGPPIFLKVNRYVVSGSPRHVTTSYVERHNWTLRGINRRMTRLSNGFSRKLDNLKAQVALSYYFYNMVKPHGSLGGRTPAMALGVWPDPWTLEKLAA